MFEVTIGPHTTQVECPLLEEMADKVDQILEHLLFHDANAQGRVEFTIQVREQETAHGADTDRDTAG